MMILWKHLVMIIFDNSLPKWSSSHSISLPHCKPSQWASIKFDGSNECWNASPKKNAVRQTLNSNTTFGLGRRRENLRFDVLFFKFYKQELHFSKFKFEIQMQQQMQRERVNNERNSLGENSAESVSPVSSGAPATSRDLLNALAEQKLPTLLKQETPKTPRRSKCLTPSAIHINPANGFSLSPVLKSCSQVLSFPGSIIILKSVPRWLSLSNSRSKLQNRKVQPA